MSYIAHYYNKKSKTTYCYRVTSYRDPVTGKPNSHRVLIGKLDESGQMIPTRKRGRPRSPDSDAVLGSDIVKALESKEIESYKSELERVKGERFDLLNQIDELKAEIRALKKTVIDISKVLQKGIELAESSSNS